MRIVGIDPGLTGALALLEDGILVDWHDMPVIDGRVQGPGIMALLRLDDWRPDVVVVEDIHAMPRGSIASFSIGYSLGVTVAAVLALQHPLVRIRPNEWKKIQGLTGKDKNASRLLASERWPRWASDFRRVKDDGRAEAALIADAHRRKENL